MAGYIAPSPDMILRRTVSIPQFAPQTPRPKVLHRSALVGAHDLDLNSKVKAKVKLSLLLSN
jgi:hypothetical protein